VFASGNYLLFTNTNLSLLFLCCLLSVLL